MPKRNRTRKYIGGPQGDDAEIVMKVPTVGELNVNQKMIKNILKNDEEKEEKEADGAAQTLLIGQIISWNWVDDDDEVIPLPKDRSNVFGKLTVEEVDYIGECFNNKTPTQVVAEKK